ncbi:MAG: transcriptional repressor [Clostridia bacterium]|nr:transcriptional repressor [Clostridia bacterium]
MAEYITEQKKLLSDFLTRHCDQAFSVEELAEQMSAEFNKKIPGKSTLYRLITRMVEEGIVKRFVKGNSRHFVYQIVAGEHCHSHLHMKCVECGKLLHLDEDLSHELLAKIRMGSNFSVSEESTVLFGECYDCNKRKGEL